MQSGLKIDSAHLKDINAAIIASSRLIETH